MSSDSEITTSPMASPSLQRGGPVRNTVAKKCREFYLKRLERTANMQKRWSMCEPSIGSLTFPQDNEDSGISVTLSKDTGDLPNGYSSTSTDNQTLASTDKIISDEDNGTYPLRKSRSSFDFAMDSLRKEISSLIAQDNDLFRQLLSLHDSIAELRERQRSCYNLYDDDDDENDETIDREADDEDVGDRDDSPSFESLSDNGDLPETSPESTLSCRSSLSSDSVNSSSRSHHHHNFHYHPHHHHRHLISSTPNNRNRPSTCKKRHRNSVGNSVEDETRPLIFVDKSRKMCFRCQKVAPPYRRSKSITNVYYYLSEDMDSYDSGIHLQGSHSDSDHEIFV